MLKENLDQVESRIARAAARAHRNRSDIQLVAVTKKFPATVIREAFELGLRDFGENYAQELHEKADELADLRDLRWHMIGHLQRNKARAVTALASVVHTVHSVELARELARCGQPLRERLQPLLEGGLGPDPVVVLGLEALDRALGGLKFARTHATAGELALE